jgi:predicted secreted protein
MGPKGDPGIGAEQIAGIDQRLLALEGALGRVRDLCSSRSQQRRWRDARAVFCRR